MSAALLLALVAAVPEHATFLFDLHGTPVGTVELSLDDGGYTYRSRHLFTRDGQVGELARSRTYSVDARDGTLPSGQQLESLWLWRKPSAGCVQLVGELTERVGRGCADPPEGDRVLGTVQGQAFDAHYREGRLIELTVGPSHFTALGANALLHAPKDLFGAGFAAPPGSGPLGLEPPAAVSRRALRPWDRAEATALAQALHETFRSSVPGSADWKDDGQDVGGCLAHARRFVAQAKAAGHDAELVLGLLVDGERAYPHAWVRAAGTELDPTLMRPVTSGEYLALDDAGQRYLELLEGTRRVVRR